MTALGHDFQASKSWLYSRSQATLDAAATHPLAQQMQVAAPEKEELVKKVITGETGNNVTPYIANLLGRNLCAPRPHARPPAHTPAC